MEGQVSRFALLPTRSLQPSKAAQCLLSWSQSPAMCQLSWGWSWHRPTRRAGSLRMSRAHDQLSVSCVGTRSLQNRIHVNVTSAPQSALLLFSFTSNITVRQSRQMLMHKQDFSFKAVRGCSG